MEQCAAPGAAAAALHCYRGITSASPSSATQKVGMKKVWCILQEFFFFFICIMTGQLEIEDQTRPNLCEIISATPGLVKVTSFREIFM